MKSGIVVAVIAVGALPWLAPAKECRGSKGGVQSVVITYLGTDIRRSRIGRQAGLYQIQNGSTRAVEMHTYDGDPPDLYPLDATLQRRDNEGQWWDMFDALDHPRPADGETKVAPGESLSFFSLTSKEAERDYRLGVRTTSNCWLYSEPFQFPRSSGKDD